MARRFQIFGDCIVKVRFGTAVTRNDKGFGKLATHLAGVAPGINPPDLELGLSTGPITVTPQVMHEPLVADGFTQQVPAERYLAGGEANISMTLIHFDQQVLDVCFEESVGGALVSGKFSLPPMGTLLGNNFAGRGSFDARFGNHYMGLIIRSENDPPGATARNDWFFPTAYLTGPPFTYPLGTEATAVVLNWKAVAYGGVFDRIYGHVTSGQALPIWHKGDFT